jgi:hypothetical protein
MKYPEIEYLGFNPDEGSKDDCGVSCQTMKIVKTKKIHPCCVGFTEMHDIQVGSMAVCEKYIFEDQGWRNSYYCIECLDKWFDEIYGGIGEYYEV